MRIVLSGPDGTGKSTIVEGLRQHLAATGEVEVTWRRFGFILGRGMNLIGRIMGWSYFEQTPFGPVGYHRYRGVFAHVYIAVCFLDCWFFIIPKWWVHDLFNRSKYQIADRYLIDIAADLILSTGNPRAVLGLFDGILKRHIRKENCILLACDPKVVIDRRPDIAYDRSYLHKISIYELLRRRYGIFQVNTDRATPEACAEQVLSVCAL